MKFKRAICGFISVVIASVSLVLPTSAANSKVDAPTGVTVASKTESSVKVSWDAVSGAEKYIVYYSTEKKDGYESYGQTSNTYATVKGLKSGTKFYFRIRAVQTVDGKKIKSGYSKAVTATTKKITDKNWDNYKTKYKYWMNPKSKKVHYNSCHTLKHYENFIGTDDLDFALSEHYDKCGVCFR